MHSHTKLLGENTQKVQHRMSTWQGRKGKMKDVALKAPRRLEEPCILWKSVAGLPTPCFYADFGVSYHKRVTETLKCEPKKSNRTRKKVFMLVWGWYWAMQKRVNMQIGRWKHACRIDFDLTKIAVYADDTFLFPHNTSIAGSDSNNRYLTNEETKIFLGFVYEKISLILTLLSTSQVVRCQGGYLLRFQFETLHFITTMLRYIAAIYWRKQAKSIRSNHLMETYLIRGFFFSHYVVKLS